MRSRGKQRLRVSLAAVADSDNDGDAPEPDARGGFLGMAGFASSPEPGRAVASSSAVAGAPESPSPSPRGSLDAPPGSPRPAAPKANEARRNALVKMVKSLETEQIKDQRRIRFVDDIYDAAKADEASSGDFISPLRRGRGDAKDLKQLRAARDAAAAGRGGRMHARASRRLSQDGVDPAADDQPGPSRRDASTSPEDVVLKASAGADAGAGGGSADGNDPRSAALRDDVEDVWVEAIRLARLRVWIFFDDPESSRAAYITSLTILAMILMSSVTFCMETMSTFETPEHSHNFFIIECLCIAAFTLEYLLKLLCCPNVRQFVLQPLNVVDLISILPFYVELLLARGGAGSTRIFRTIRLVRVFRVIKLGSRSGKVQVVTRTMYESLDMLAMMFFLLSLTVLVFATLIFFAERGTYYEETDTYSRKIDIACTGAALAADALHNADGSLVAGCERVSSPFKSIPDSFWWTMVTLMTVGYGDEVPISGEGRFVACLAMLASVLLMALPISVIGAEFTQQWMEYKKQVSELSGRGRKAAPRFLELTKSLKNHMQVTDETLRKMRDMQAEIDERMMRIRQMVHHRTKENQALKRKALVKGKLAVEALLDNKSSENFEQERKLQMEMEALLEDREKLLKSAATAELLLSAGFPDVIKACLEKYAFMQELREDDYEMITAEIDNLHFRAVQWHGFRSKSGGGSSGRRRGSGDKPEGWGIGRGGESPPRTPADQPRGAAATPMDAVATPMSVGHQL